MLKRSVKRLAQRAGLYIASRDRLGIDLEVDLTRLSAHAPLNTIFDVGGNFGQTACRFASAFPSSRIFSFEPVPSSFARLRKSILPYSAIRAFDIALGETSGIAKINIHPNAGSNSIKPLGTVNGTLDVQIDTIDRFADENNVKVIDLLKIDVEGYELPVLRGAARYLSEGLIRFVYAECILSPSTEMPHTSFFELHNFLEKAGFCFFNYYAESFHLRLGCAMGNVLYALRDKLPLKVPGNVRNII